MNMLLPFLLTARPGRIDAAGEQVGILKSWMLADRSDPQPVGYLWIEFERAGHYLTCGCGIKANRQSDTVTTWWFVAERRVGIDLHLAEGGTALSADALRAQLDGEEVFPDVRRREYRAEVERRLFGGVAKEGPCADPEAAFGHRRGDGPGQRDELFFGYYASVMTMVRSEHGGAVPELIRRVQLASCRHDPVPGFVAVVTRSAASGVVVHEVLADSG